MEYVRFGELYKIPSCNGLSRPRAVRGEGYKMVNMGELFSNDIINDMYMERVQMNEREQKKFLLEKGDLLFARQSLVATGAGKCSVVNNLAEKTTFESHLIRVRLDETKANPLYYYYLFQLPYNPVKTIVNQCAQAGIRGTELVRIKVPLPNIEYQNTIANALFQYDKLIENNNKRIKLLEQMAENLYKEWFVRFRFPGHEDVKFNGSVPSGWQYQLISESMIFYDSQRVPLSSMQRDKMDKIYPYYGAAKLMDYVDDYLFDGEYLLLGEDGTVVTTDGFPVLQLVNDKFWVNNHAHVIRGKGNISTRFLYLTFCRFPITGVVTGSAQPKISKGRLEKLKILVPDAITMEYFNNLINPMFDEINVLKKQLIRITQQRDMLLPRLMSGKLEV